MALVVNNLPAKCRRPKRLGFAPWVGKIPWRRAWQPTPVFPPGESHGQRSLVGYFLTLPLPVSCTASDCCGFLHCYFRSMAHDVRWVDSGKWEYLNDSTDPQIRTSPDVSHVEVLLDFGYKALMGRWSSPQLRATWRSSWSHLLQL